MSLPSGHRLGPYEIVAPLGAGGMGEVYRALDVRLRREVAVKVLPTALAGDADRLRRFEQEARASAALAHPGVISVHDFGLEQGAPYLVTELLTGRTLRELVESGPLAPARALDLARQALDALAAAHEHGIVHRDLKPENLFVTREGRLKILDFGLARLVETPGGELGDAPTQVGLTQSGVIVGTIGYMAPEQVQGERVDHRADLFALGVVLYEMLTGRRAFAAKSAVDTLHAILNAEPEPVSSLVRGLPAGVDAVLRRCLAKSPEARFQSARDLAFALELAAAPAAAAAESSAPAGLRRRFPRWAPAAAAASAVAALVVAALAVRSAVSWRAPAPGGARFAAALSPLTTDPGYESEPSFAPDGETFAYVADRSGDFEIYLQQTSGGAAINLTHHPGDDVQPAISPDGRQIAFVSTRSSRHALIYPAPAVPLVGGDIWVTPTLGGLARKVAEDGNFPAWSPDGSTIYFVRAIWFRSELRRVPASGGASEVVPVELEPGFSPTFLLHPRPSPDGGWLLFRAGERIYVSPVAGGRAVPIGVGTEPTWEADGRGVLFCNSEPGRNFGLWRAGFDPAQGRPDGTNGPLLVGPAPLGGLALSRDGRRLLVAAVDRTANLEELPVDVEQGVVTGPPRALTHGRHEITFASLSPSGHSIVFEDRLGAAAHLWRLDAGATPVQLTSDARFSESFPRWSPDGTTIAFTRRIRSAARDPANAALWRIAPDGGDPRPLVEAGGNAVWLPDGRRLVYVHRNEAWSVDRDGGEPRPIPISGPAAMPIRVVSPDGAWLVYQTAEGGDVDIVRVPIAGGEARSVVSTERQDFHPLFSPSGRWLYFQPDHRNLWRVPGPAQGWRTAPPEKVTDFPESGLYLEEPQLAADGRKIVYSRVRTVADLWLVELDPAPAEEGDRGGPF